MVHNRRVSGLDISEGAMKTSFDTYLRYEELTRTLRALAEWAMMEQGEHSRRVDKITRELRETNNEFEPRTSTEEMLQREELARINDLANERGLRLHANREGIPLMLWIVLIFGGVVTVAFTYLLEMQVFWIHALSVVTLTAMLALVSYTIYTIDSPFGQGVRLGPEAFEFQLGPEALEFQLHEFEEFEKGG
jgi:hypothetical protein